jgi:hypothetical protein
MTTPESDAEVLKELDFAIACQYPESCTEPAVWIMKNSCCGVTVGYLCNQGRAIAMNKNAGMEIMGVVLTCGPCKTTRRPSVAFTFEAIEGEP